MLLSSTWPLLSSFLLAFTTSVSAHNLTFAWPKYPEANVGFSLTCDGGTAPYTVHVFTPDLTKYYYKYQGNEPSTTYNFPLNAGTEVVFQCRDSGEHVITSPTVTVLAGLLLQHPHDLQSGVTVQGNGGLLNKRWYTVHSTKSVECTTSSSSSTSGPSSTPTSTTSPTSSSSSNPSSTVPPTSTTTSRYTSRTTTTTSSGGGGSYGGGGGGGGGHHHKHEIIGGVVGGALGGLCVLSLLWYFCRSRLTPAPAPYSGTYSASA